MDKLEYSTNKSNYSITISTSNFWFTRSETTTDLTFFNIFWSKISWCNLEYGCGNVKGVIIHNNN
jgi:hypothetical protein